MGKTLKRLAVAVGLAAAVGYVAGMLTAPKSGKETREDLKQAAKSGMSEAERQLKNVSSELADALEEAKKRGADLSDRARKQLNDVMDQARAAREKAREVVSAVHEGDADDDDLRLAVSQSTSALKHLRDYLRK
jgi:gas vesicle protein